MKTIHKFRINPGKEPTRLTLKRGFRVVRCEYLVSEKGVFLWVEQPLQVTTPTVECQFRIVFSGDPVPETYQYLGTALDTFGPEAYHVFEVRADSHASAVDQAEQHTADQALFGGGPYQAVATN
ncbi:DUF7352 domain-containing protein [Marinobacter zhanjiangensis]|uniref:DUF7352 domain-containing protein n=1 Tax=Marinobacter zhanjiangensis TaxID=578215 RepID=A0ABQ3ATH1_9GAMM|nr:hypothetical protein [Marinobacter zhanjiangensis]GGY66811.1 hypothetical protein GCM10007071_12160 [Marinobacter zhanjiangensis]